MRNPMAKPAKSLLALLAALLFSPAMAETPRTVVLGGSVAEIVAALGAEGQLVGRDTTSTYPETLLALPDVGYVRALSPEGVLSLTPDLILAEPDAGPPPVIDVLRAAGVSYVTIPGDPTPAGVLDKITATAAALGRDEAGQALADTVQKEVQAAQAAAAAILESGRKTVLFVLSLQGGAVMAAGANSSAQGMIELAGAKNAAAGFDGYKPITDEAILAAAPDVILVMDRAGDLAISDDLIRAHPALGRSPAAQSGAIIRMDGLFLLGFGPRTGQAALALNRAIYGTGGL